jgi:hypothetical protein
MTTPRQTYTAARQQLEREAVITICVNVALPDGTTTTVDWPTEWEAPTYEEADQLGSDLDTAVWELVSDAMGRVVRAELGEYPPPTPEEAAELRSKAIAMGIDPDDPGAPFAAFWASLHER